MSDTPAQAPDEQRLAAVADDAAVDGSLSATAALDRLAALAALLLGARTAYVSVPGEHDDGPAADAIAAVVPLRGAGGDVLGALHVVDAAPREWTERDRRVLAALADAAAAEVTRTAVLRGLRTDGDRRAQTADDLAATLGRERTALQHAELLRGAAVALAHHNDATSVLEALAQTAIPALGSWCTVHLPTATGRLALAAAAHEHAPSTDALRAEAIEEGPLADAVARAMRTGREELLEAPGGRQALVLPLLARGRTLAVMTLVGADGHSPLAAGGGDVARALASQAGVALDNALLHDAQAEIAVTLQRALQPRELPVLEGIELGARFRPAGRTNEVGGDFYDVFTRGEPGTAAFVIGDVVGKGAGAATLTSVVRHTLRAAFLHGDPPAAAVELAARALGDIAVGTEFCTAVYGEVRHRAGSAELSLVRAGHLPPLLLRADGHVEALEPTGGLIGALETVETEVLEVRLGPGDALLLVTDGVTELGQRGGPDGADALRALLATLAGLSARAVAEAVEHQAVLLSDGAPRDDVAVLVLRVAP